MLYAPTRSPVSSTACPPDLPTCPPACSPEKARLDELKALAKKREQLQIRLEQAENRLDLAVVADIKYGEWSGAVSGAGTRAGWGC